MKKALALILALALTGASAQTTPTPVINTPAPALTTITAPDGSSVSVSQPTNQNPPSRPNNAPVGVVSMPPSLYFWVNYGVNPPTNYGYNTMRILSSSDTGSSAPAQNAAIGGEGGDFRLNCLFSHQGRYDPLVYPGRPEAGHLHDFFGNSDVNGLLTEKTLGNLALFGRSSCHGGLANRSGYWSPSLIDTTTGTPITTSTNNVYYKNGSNFRNVQPHELLVTAPPPGLRMIAGTPSATSGAGNAAIVGGSYWQCLAGNGSASTQFSSNLDHIPTAADLAANPTVCADPRDYLEMSVGFPQCWDGVNLDSPNHQSHVKYEDYNLGCNDPGFPVMLPQISFNIRWTMQKLGGRDKIPNYRLSADNYPLTSPGGYSLHGDWINGWNQLILQTMVNNCLHTKTDCHDDVIDSYGTLPYRILY